MSESSVLLGRLMVADKVTATNYMIEEINRRANEDAVKRTEINPNKIPKYVQGLMERCEFVLGSGYPGYTIKLHKGGCYDYHTTTNDEADRLVCYCRKHFGVSYVNQYLTYTQHSDQSVIITIFDPVMKHLEKYMDWKPTVKYPTYPGAAGHDFSEIYGPIECKLENVDATIDEYVEKW